MEAGNKCKVCGEMSSQNFNQGDKMCTSCKQFYSRSNNAMR